MTLISAIQTHTQKYIDFYISLLKHLEIRTSNIEIDRDTLFFFFLSHCTLNWEVAQYTINEAQQFRNYEFLILVMSLVYVVLFLSKLLLFVNIVKFRPEGCHHIPRREH